MLFSTPKTHTYRKWEYVSIYMEAPMMPGGIIGLCLSKQSQLTCLTLAVTVYSTNTKAGLTSWAIGGLATSTVQYLCEK